VGHRRRNLDDLLEIAFDYLGVLKEGVLQRPVRVLNASDDYGGAIVPFGGNDWLALTEEATLESEMPICDPHHHFWDFRTARIPYHRYLLHELAADIHSGYDVRSTVFIEARAMYRAAGPAEMRPVGRGRIRPGTGRRQRQRSLRPRPGRRRHCRSRQPEPGRASGPGA
jgi:hypothetical protein